MYFCSFCLRFLFHLAISIHRLLVNESYQYSILLSNGLMERVASFYVVLSCYSSISGFTICILAWICIWWVFHLIFFMLSISTCNSVLLVLGYGYFGLYHWYSFLDIHAVGVSSNLLHIIGFRLLIFPPELYYMLQLLRFFYQSSSVEAYWWKILSSSL